ncbi:thiamine biosynthesis protein ThiF [Bacillus lacus]|uniref:Thiamine biosynthesis protein ThiF n=1 Tax=Metabacillus lacus TaxID=1983721 RepID=A0A7X2IY48_9BACI|nr:E2/UBC family protein [Metabacillus lacus]MRX71956.1 thiamine biosynthesis protein ThiF [Metabacillus lacus]
MTTIVEVLERALQDLLPSFKKIMSQGVNSRRGPFQAAFEGVHSIEGKQITIQIALPKHFPIEKPMIFLKNPKVLGFLPHIEKDGFICYSFDEGLLLDRSNPFGIIQEAFFRAENTLQDGISRKNHDDFLKEFESLWSRQEKIVKVDTLFSPRDDFQQILVFMDNKREKTVFVNNLDSGTKRTLNTLYKCDVANEFQSLRGIYIPLREGADVKPPPYWKFWDIKQLRKIIFENITSSTKRKLNAYLKKRTFNKNDKEYMLISIPLGQEQKILIGILLKDFSKKQNVKMMYPIQHPLKKVQCNFSVIPLTIKRHDKEYLLNRTQGNNRLVGKRVTIIGLGSLGSRIAFELARAGVTSVTLIDKDRIDIDNIYRHELGANSLYWRFDNKFSSISKAEALKMELNNHFPFLEIEYEIADVLDLMEEEIDLILNADLIIVALGSPTVELHFNERFYKIEEAPPVIYTWIDPLGIGGHALLTNNNKKEGCFQCLFTHPEENEYLIPNKASFAAPEQFFGKTLAGCESMFTPYGSIDALQTAITATRLAVDNLNQKVIGNPLRSWKGDSNELLTQEYKVSKRYGLSSEQLYDSRYLYQAGNCSVCGSVNQHEF